MGQPPRRETPVSDRRTLWLQIILLAAVLSSIVHYTDNTIRFDSYPQDDPELVSRPMIPVSWVLFTAFGALGYVLFRRNRWWAAAACLAVYSISGLISPLHYLYGSLSEFDVAQHVFILTDGIAGLAVLGFAVSLLRRPVHQGPR
jgi:hypothetical protein